MRGNLAVSIFILLISFSEILAQQYNFKRYSVEEGLPRSGVYCLMEDSRGYLWIGTEGGGLAQFDGKEFIVYTTNDGLADNTVRSMFEDREGYLWFGTNGKGLCRFNGNTFRTFSTDDGLSNNYIRCITQDTAGAIWVGTFGGGINKLEFGNDSLQVTIFNANGPLKSNRVRSAISDANGSLWFGTDKGLYQTVDGSTWDYYSKEDGLSHNQVLVLYKDLLDNIWVGTQEGVSLKVDTGFVSYTQDDGLINNRIRGIVQDHTGNMWFGTSKGITRFNGMTFISFTEANGLSNDRIRHMITDRSGNLWLGTYFGGICKFAGNEFIHFTEEEGLADNQVLSIYNSQDGHIWLGSFEGVNELVPSTDGSWEISDNLLRNLGRSRSVYAIAEGPNNELWLGTNRGILVKKQDQINSLITDDNVFSEDVKALLVESDGSFWTGGTNGISRYILDNGKYVFDQYYSKQNINESEVSTIYKDHFGRIWIGFLNSDIVVFENGVFNELELPDQLHNVSAIVGDRKKFIWIATEGSGLFRRRSTRERVEKSDFEQISLADGLSSADLHQLVFDGQNNLWAGTVSGVDQIILNSNSEIKNIIHYGVEEGFIGTETNENAACLDVSGNLWFGTIRGATKYDPMAQTVSQVEPALHITKVSLEFDDSDWTNSKYADGAAGFFKIPVNLTLPYSENNLSIEYNAIDLRGSRKIRYQWKLEGYHDNRWSLVEKENSVTFTNLAPNDYVFHLRACGADEVWTSEPIIYKFTVLPPYWMRWWFILLCCIAIVFIVWTIVKLNNQRLVRDKERLQQKVDERTAELRVAKERSDELLLNILPIETAEELKEKGYASVQEYDRVSVLFTDFVGFTNITEEITNEELVRSLDEHFRMFDEVMDKYRIEKIKTIGDAYMAAAGIPRRTDVNPLAAVAAGLEMIDRLKGHNELKEAKGLKPWQLRLGIHTGNLISGVVGKNKFAFDIWGDTVNTAARMESSGEVMKVNVSGSTYQLVKNYFNCTPRGKIKAKNKGQIEMYFVDSFKSEYCHPDNDHIPNAKFLAILGVGKNVMSLN